jgi:hypothetical protein
VLSAAVAKTAAVDLTFILDGGPGQPDITGTYDADSRIAFSSQTENGEQTTFTADGDSLYLAGPSDLNGLAVRLHAKRLAPTNLLALFADPFGPATLLSGITSAALHGTTDFEGSIDLAKITATNDGAAALYTCVNAAAGARADDVPFTASINADGYLVSLDLTLPNIDHGSDEKYTVTLADFGKDQSNAVPTGDSVVEAPDTAYTAS